MASANYRMMLEELERDLAPIERQRRELITAINVIRAKVGLSPRPGGGGGSGDATAAVAGGGALPVEIKSDAFVGKRIGSASREFLNLRQGQGIAGPASPREIYDGLLAGGFEFSSKGETIRLISLRNMLRRNVDIFKKFENGKYGLMEWCGDLAKTVKPTDTPEQDETDVQETETTANLKAAVVP